jgi:hypothetical protein
VVAARREALLDASTRGRKQTHQRDAEGQAGYSVLLIEWSKDAHPVASRYLIRGGFEGGEIYLNRAAGGDTYRCCGDAASSDTKNVASRSTAQQARARAYRPSLNAWRPWAHLFAQGAGALMQLWGAANGGISSIRFGAARRISHSDTHCRSGGYTCGLYMRRRTSQHNQQRQKIQSGRSHMQHTTAHAHTHTQSVYT